MALTERDICELVKIADKHVPIDNEIIAGIDVKGDQFKAKFTTFTNSTFEGLVLFDNVDLSVGLIFEDCKFQESVIFKNIKASGFDNVMNPDSLSLAFKKCTFSQIVKLGGKNTEVNEQVLFEECSFKEGVEIDGLKIRNVGLTVRKCIIDKKFDIYHVLTQQNILLESNTSNYYSRIEYVDCLNLVISENNLFNDRFHVLMSEFQQGIVFYNGSFKKEIEITLVNTGKEGLRILGSHFEKAFFVSYHSGKAKPIKGIYSFYLNDAKFLNGIYVVGKNDLFSDEPQVEEITITLSAELKGDIVFRDLNIGILNVGGYNNTANLFFKDLFINQIKFSGLINNAGFIMSGVRASLDTWYKDDDLKDRRWNAIYINDCNFGKAQFFQTDFSSFDRISFRNNILTDISTSLVKWFSPAQIDEFDVSASISSYKNARKTRDKERIQREVRALGSVYRSKKEVFRQLKYVSQKQSDLPQALEFQRHEMNYYRKIVKLISPINQSDRLILWSSQTNNFGQNWIKPLALLGIFLLIAYLPIGFLTSNELDYSTPLKSWSDLLLNIRVVFCDNLYKACILANPVHRTSELFEGITPVPRSIYVWDLLSRIGVSYFIFQIITAFRKFNK